MKSIGFVEADPIIVVNEDGHFIVREGNRRLTALRYLCNNPSEQSQLQPHQRITLDTEIAVETDWDKDQLNSYLGYKHVTASKEWGPQEKAAFVLSIADGDLTDENLRKYADRFGTYIGVLKKWLVAMLVIQDIQARGLFDPRLAHTRRYFGTYYTLLSSSVMQEYIGITFGGGLSDFKLTAQAAARAAELLVWLVGQGEQEPIISSRDQSALEQIVLNERSLEVLRLEKRIDVALRYTDFQASEISLVFYKARIALDDCLRTLYDVREDPKVRQAFGELQHTIAKLALNMGESQ